MAAKVNKLIPMNPSTKKTTTYISFFKQLKDRVRQAQVKASLAVNAELIQLYWDMGKSIVEKQEKEGWGSSVIENLCVDLQGEFPGIKGFSRRNIFRMQAFYQCYAKVPQAVALLEDIPNSLPIVKIPWGHNVLLLEKIKNNQERLWYANQVIEHGLSRSALENWIAVKAYKRHGRAITNFASRLPAPQSQLAQEILKDPYNFDFLTLDANYRETELEQALIDNIQKLLLELGKGFAFIGRQYHLEASGNSYYLDLLFYHTKLHCYCVIELKNTDFKPEYAGKLNFYLSIVDDRLKGKDDNPSIGMLLCKSKDKLIVEYALRDINKPIGISGYVTKALKTLSKKLQSSLPTIEDIEAELGSVGVVSDAVGKNAHKKTTKRAVKKTSRVVRAMKK